MVVSDLVAHSASSLQMYPCKGQDAGRTLSMLKRRRLKRQTRRRRRRSPTRQDGPASSAARNEVAEEGKRRQRRQSSQPTEGTGKHHNGGVACEARGRRTVQERRHRGWSHTEGKVGQFEQEKKKFRAPWMRRKAVHVGTRRPVEQACVQVAV
jgi:hypothetical protein